MRHQGEGTACIHRRSSTGRRLLQWSTRRWMFLGDGLTDTWWSPSNLMMKCSSHIEKRKRKKMIDNDQKQNIAEIFLLWFFRISRVRIWKKERNKSCLGGKSRESIRVIIRNDDDLGTISGWWGAGIGLLEKRL